jgi:DTW domain-containing protein YfiP
MSRRDNARHRCRRCRMLGGLCVCALMPSPRLATRTRLVLVIHRFEDRKPTNTGRLAAECLENSVVVVRGHESQPLLLFPHEGATPLAEARIDRDRPVTLVVPDGNWRQASKVRQRVPGLSELTCVRLPVGERSIYRLRAEAHEAGLSTIEAIGRAMGLLEGDHVRQALELVFRAMVERTLWSRGRVPAAEVTGGIPAGTMRHDPRTAHPERETVTTSRPGPR